MLLATGGEDVQVSLGSAWAQGPEIPLGPQIPLSPDLRLPHQRLFCHTERTQAHVLLQGLCWLFSLNEMNSSGSWEMLGEQIC